MVNKISKPTIGNRSPTALRIDHFCSLLLYLGGIFLWIYCIMHGLSETSEGDFFVSLNYVDYSREGVRARKLECSAKHIDPAQYSLLSASGGLCAQYSNSGNDDNTVSQIPGCDIELLDTLGVNQISDSDATAACKTLCSCTSENTECWGFSTYRNTSRTFCRLYTNQLTCINITNVVITQQSNQAKTYPIFQPSNKIVHQSSINLIQTVDQTPHARCFAKEGFCASDCLGMTCDELSVKTGLSCRYCLMLLSYVYLIYNCHNVVRLISSQVSSTLFSPCFAKFYTFAWTRSIIYIVQIVSHLQFYTTIKMDTSHLETHAGCNCAGCGCSQCEKCIFPFKWREKDWHNCTPFSNADVSDISWCPLDTLSKAGDSIPYYYDGMPRMACPETTTCKSTITSTQTDQISSSGNAKVDVDINAVRTYNIDRIRFTELPYIPKLCFDVNFLYLDIANSSKNCRLWEGWNVDAYRTQLNTTSGNNNGSSSDIDATLDESSMIMSSLTPFDSISIVVGVKNNLGDQMQATIYIPQSWSFSSNSEKTVIFFDLFVSFFSLSVVLALYHWFTGATCRRRLEDVNLKGKCNHIQHSCLLGCHKVFYYFWYCFS